MNNNMLTKYMLGEATESERKVAENWIAASQAHQKEYAQLQYIWEESKKIAIAQPVDTDMAWEKFKQKRSSIRSRQSIRSMRSYLLRAAILILAGAALLLYLNDRYNRDRTELASNGQTLQNQLPDGSKITLNKHSLLSYKRSAFGSERQAELQQGEAFFDIAPQKSPFILRVNGVQVRVLGTSFNVRSDSGNVRITVASGQVEVINKYVRVRLRRDEQVTIRKGQRAIQKEKTRDQLYNYYYSLTFQTNKTPLWRVVEVLGEAYNSKIVITDPQLRNLPLTAVFTRNESLDRILEIIGITFNTKVTRKGDQIFLGN